MTVRKALATGAKVRKAPPLGRWMAVASAALVLLFTVAVNALPALALSLQEVPVLGPIVRVLTVARFSAASDEQMYAVDIEVPELQGLADPSLEASLNAKYLGEGRALYDGLMQELGALEEGELAHKALEAGYRIKHQNDRLIVVERWVLVVMASGTASVTYDNIDLHSQVLLTLPSLFVDDSYVSTITDNIKRQMRDQMEATALERFFFVDEFESIAPDQTFYISENGKLIIVFDEYEVAPGSMGVVEFEIPTEVIADALVGGGYIR